MSDKFIYIVEGSSGEYSDHREWHIAAYLDEAEARKHAEAASAYARETHQMYLDADDDWDRQGEILSSRGRDNPYDTSFVGAPYFSQTEVRYTAFPVPVRKKAPTPDDPRRARSER